MIESRVNCAKCISREKSSDERSERNAENLRCPFAANVEKVKPYWGCNYSEMSRKVVRRSRLPLDSRREHFRLWFTTSQRSCRLRRRWRENENAIELNSHQVSTYTRFTVNADVVLSETRFIHRCIQSLLNQPVVTQNRNNCGSDRPRRTFIHLQNWRLMKNRFTFSVARKLNGKLFTNLFLAHYREQTRRSSGERSGTSDIC